MCTTSNLYRYWRKRSALSIPPSEKRKLCVKLWTYIAFRVLCVFCLIFFHFVFEIFSFCRLSSVFHLIFYFDFHKWQMADAMNSVSRFSCFIGIIWIVNIFLCSRNNEWRFWASITFHGLCGWSFIVIVRNEANQKMWIITAIRSGVTVFSLIPPRNPHTRPDRNWTLDPFIHIFFIYLYLRALKYHVSNFYSYL